MNVVSKTRALLWRRCAGAFFLVMLIGMGSLEKDAWSFDRAPALLQETKHMTAVVRAPDACLYILEQVRERVEYPARAPSYRRAAVPAVAAGLVFGVRFALGPAEDNTIHRQISRGDTGSAQALVVADYRACRNALTLRTLTD